LYRALEVACAAYASLNLSSLHYITLHYITYPVVQHESIICVPPDESVAIPEFPQNENPGNRHCCWSIIMLKSDIVCESYDNVHRGLLFFPDTM